MSQRLGFWKDCWIYTHRVERENMRFILSYLRVHKSVCISQLLEAKKSKSKAAMRNALLYLVIGRVLKVEQHKEVRVYTLNKGWITKLKKMTTPFIKTSSYRRPWRSGGVPSDKKLDPQPKPDEIPGQPNAATIFTEPQEAKDSWIST